MKSILLLLFLLFIILLLNQVCRQAHRHME